MEVVVCSEAMCKLMRMVERVARGNAAVLITGETGSGKELIARSLHHHSLRAGCPWVDVNCAALPEHLVESELFGYEKGAFSGADAPKKGLFELADKGTLFLDEVGELEPRTQVKLLRVLDGIPYYRLGGNRKVAVDVRIIAATNQPLESAIKAGQFRSDLFHRLSQIQLRVPPLRERPEDVAAMAEYFLAQSYPGRKLSPAALEVLGLHAWPGNIRELRNVVLQAATMAVDDVEIRPCHLPAQLTRNGPAQPATASAEQQSLALADIEKQAILRALARAGGHQGLTAEKLGISRRTLSRKLKQYNVGSRQSQPQSLGTLSGGEQLRFRAGAAMPVTICMRDVEYYAKASNVSVGGLALEGVSGGLQLSQPFPVRFTLPETVEHFELQAELIWADRQGKAGVRFVDTPQGQQERLKNWLKQQQLQEGWTIVES